MSKGKLYDLADCDPTTLTQLLDKAKRDFSEYLWRFKGDRDVAEELMAWGELYLGKEALDEPDNSYRKLENGENDDLSEYQRR